MTTYVEARDAIVSFIETNFSAIPRFYEDAQTVDLDAVGTTFLKIGIEFVEGYQASLGAQPLDRTLGIIYFCVFSKEATGGRAALQIFDTLKQTIQYQRLGGVQLEAVRPGDVERQKGWVNRELLVPFWFDSTA